MRSSRLSLVQSFLLMLLLSVPAWTQNSRPARPGTINYVEGQASIDRQILNPDSVGSLELESGQSLETQGGKAEILLTPGVFLRVGDNSSVRMISPDLANTEVAVEKGRALVEVADIRKENNIRIDEPTSTKRGSTLTVALVGTAPDGIGIPGSECIRLFQATEYSTALLGVVFIRRS